MTELELKIYDLVRRIPEGKVATYGQIARMAGDGHLARVVGNVMHKNPYPFWELGNKVGFDYDYSKNVFPENFPPVPCHRVVNSAGKMGANFGMGGPEIQAAMLRTEGVEVVDGKIQNLEKYLFAGKE